MSTPLGVPQRLFRGYGPLVGFAIMFLAVALLVPSQTQKVATAPSNIVETAPVPGEGDQLDPSSDTSTTAPADGATDPALAPGQAAGGGAEAGSSGGTRVAGASATRPGTAAAPGAGSTGAAAKGSSAGIGFCADRRKQDPNDPYSPPCYTFSGDNGGATSPGVTKDAVNLSVRIQGFDNGLLDAISKVAGAKIPAESRATITNTVAGLVDYFNRTYNFYGRKLNLTVWEGRGSVEKELLGGGQEGAEGDALQAQTQIKAFADASAVTPPYVDALARRKIVSSGAPFMSQQWMAQRRPYAWSPLTDCSTIVTSVASYYVAKMAGKPAAYAGGALKGQPRRSAIIAPDNSWYQECADAGAQLVRAAGFGGELILDEAYRLDLNQMSQQATSLIQKLKANNITTVVCGCDPLIISFLTAKAKEQQYQPEWVETGVALTDQDLVAQIFDPGVWNKAFGVSFAGPTQAIRAGQGYRAFKAVRPTQEPSIGADLIYQNLQIIALGIQMAGPKLTPESFEAGMFKYPAATGPFGTWNFGPNDYTASNDAREVWWNSGGRSPQNSEAGTWVDANPGTRFSLGKFPPGEPKVG